METEPQPPLALEPVPEPEQMTRQNTADAIAMLQAKGYAVSSSSPTADANPGAVLPPLTEASDRDMATDPAHPPTAFTHVEWCEARDALRGLGAPFKEAEGDWRQRVFFASRAMNQMQHHYGDLLSHVANHGGLFCERAVHVLVQKAPGVAQDSLNNRINLVTVRSVDVYGENRPEC